MVKAIEAFKGLKGLGSPKKIKPLSSAAPVSPGGVQIKLQGFSLQEDAFAKQMTPPTSPSLGLKPGKSPKSPGGIVKAKKKIKPKKLPLSAFLSSEYQNTVPILGRMVEKSGVGADPLLHLKPPITFQKENLKLSPHAAVRLKERYFSIEALLKVINHAPIYESAKKGEKRLIQYGRLGSSEGGGDMKVVRVKAHPEKVVTVIRQENNIPDCYSYWQD